MADGFFDDLFRVDEEEEFMLFCMMEDERRERKEKEKEERLLFGDPDDDDDDSDEFFTGGSTFSRSSSTSKTPPPQLYLSAPLMNEANPIPETVSHEELKRCRNYVKNSAQASIVTVLVFSLIPALLMWATVSFVYDPLDKGSGWFTLIIVLAGLGFIGLVVKAMGESFWKDWKRYSKIKAAYKHSMTKGGGDNGG